MFLKTHINTLYFAHINNKIEFPDELKFNGPTEEESWVNYKNIYNYPKNFIYSTVYFSKPWQIYFRELNKPTLPPKELEYKDCFKEKIFMLNNDH